MRKIVSNLAVSAIRNPQSAINPPMRIAHIITRMIVGGAQENTLYNCQDLIAEHGDDVLLITGPSIGPEGALLQQGRGAEVPLEIISSLRRAIHPLNDTRAYYALRRAIRSFRPDVVHTHSAKGGFLGRLAAWAERAPAIVHTVHGAPFHPYQSLAARRLFQQCERYAARRCHHLISVADAMTDLMVSAGVAPREKFTTVYSGMDVEPLLAANSHRDSMRASLGYAPEHVVVGKIARLFALKGHDDVIEAAKGVVASNPQVRFLLIGDGILRATLERQIESAGLGKYFQFTGLVSPAKIPEYLGAIDLLVHASLREGLARALPQALIAGKPVVSYDVDGAREVAIGGETGFLVPPRDIAGLTSAISKLVADADLRCQLGSTGRGRFTNQFRHQTMTRQIRALYERVLAEQGGDGNKPPR
jgi:glycosyltransferase involved in cell wall biosynthesis